MKITRTKDGYGRPAIKLQAERTEDQDTINIITEFIMQYVPDDRVFEFGMSHRGMNYTCIPTAPFDDLCARIAAGDPEIVAVP